MDSGWHIDGFKLKTLDEITEEIRGDRGKDPGWHPGAPHIERSKGRRGVSREKEHRGRRETKGPRCHQGEGPATGTTRNWFGGYFLPPTFPEAALPSCSPGRWAQGLKLTLSSDLGSSTQWLRGCNLLSDFTELSLHVHRENKSDVTFQ